MVTMPIEVKSLRVALIEGLNNLKTVERYLLQVQFGAKIVISPGHLFSDFHGLLTACKR